MAKGLLHEQPEVLDFRIANVERVHVRGVPLHHGRIALLASHLSNFLFPAKCLNNQIFFLTKPGKLQHQLFVGWGAADAADGLVDHALSSVYSP